MLSGYNLNIVYRVGRKNPTDTPSCWPDYTKALEDPADALEGICIATVLTALCNATFRLWQLHAVAMQEN
jgi:hypothetical protein